MIRLRVADTEKNAPPKIELIPETFDELACRAYEINVEEYPRRICSYSMILNNDKFVIVSKGGNGIVAYFYFERAFYEDGLGWFYVDDGCKNKKKMSVKRLYFIVKGLLEGERFE